MPTLRAYFLLALALSLLIPPSFALEILEPKDKAVVFTDLLPIKISAPQTKQIKINNQDYALDSVAEFKGDLVLRPGKNFAYIMEGNSSKGLRVLRKISFPDIDRRYNEQLHWARKQVVHLATLGIIEGYPDGNFYPQTPVQKGEFATWLAKAKGMALPTLSLDVFYDVPKEHWRAPYVAAIVSARYMEPESPQTFGIDDRLTRVDAAIAICRAENVQSVTEVKKVFADVPSYYDEADLIFQAHREALIEGIVARRTKRFEPERFMTRAEAATLLFRTKLMRQSITSLLNFDEGYDREVLCKINTAPKIESARVDPRTLKIGANNIVLQAKIIDRQGKEDILRVAADFGEAGVYQEIPLVDQGGGFYALRAAINFPSPGNFMIKIIAIDKLGAKSEGSLPVNIQ